MWSLPRKVRSVERFSESACALSAAEALILMSSPTSGPRRVPTAAVYYPRAKNGPAPDHVSTMPMLTAGNDTLLSPSAELWPGAAASDYARFRHAIVLSRNAVKNSIETCLLLWFTEECLDDRPVSMLSRRLGLKTAAGAPVQGPVAVCTFSLQNQLRWRDYNSKSPIIHGTGSWVHVPTVSACAGRVPVLPSQAYVISQAGEL